MSSKPPKLLLVSGTPPGSGDVGAINLRDLCRHYPAGHVCSFVVMAPSYPHVAEPELADLPTRFVTRRYETPHRAFSGKLGSAMAWASSRWAFLPYVRKLVKQAAELGREHQVDKVWQVLDSPTTIAMGAEVARALDVPLLTSVWDPPDYVLRQAGIDRLTRAHLLHKFGEALSHSERTSVVSETMQEDYGREHGANAVIVRHGLALDDRRGAATQPDSDTEFTMGYAGSLYAKDAWDALMTALSSVGWQLGERKVIVRTLGLTFRFTCQFKAHIEYLGWRSTSETAEILSACDVNYLPYPFQEGMRDVARYSFPSKLGMYAATGRPVFIHAPPYASTAKFFDHSPIGARCQSLDADEIVAALQELAADPERYARSAELAASVARTEFTQEHFLKCFADFVGVDRRVLPMSCTDVNEAVHASPSPDVEP